MAILDDINMAEKNRTYYRNLVAMGHERNQQTVDEYTAKIDRLKDELLNDPNYDRLFTELDEVQKRSKVRTITAEQIIHELKSITRYFCISKKAMDGVTVDVDINAETFPNAYKFMPESTQFTATFKSGGWQITGIGRYSTNRYTVRVEHTEASKQALIDRFTIFD